MNFIRHHWFGLIVSLGFCFFMAVFFMVLIAPSQDEQKRGFIPCSEEMVRQVQQCSGQKICVLQAVCADTFCNIKVIGRGWRQWWRGEQPRPWSNYLFAPKLPEHYSRGDDGEYYAPAHEVRAQMQNLQKLNDELEKEYERRKASGVESDGFVPEH